MSRIRIIAVITAILFYTGLYADTIHPQANWKGTANGKPKLKLSENSLEIGTLQAKVRSLPHYQLGGSYLVFGSNATGTEFYFAGINDKSNRLVIGKMVNGKRQILKQRGFNVRTRKYYDLRLELTANEVQLFVNHKSRLTLSLEKPISGQTGYYLVSGKGQFTNGMIIDKKLITNPNLKPIAKVEGDRQGAVNQPLSFSGTASYDPDGDSLTYIWDFGDGKTAAGISGEYRYTSPGLYKVSLTVNDGELSATDIFLVKVDKTFSIPNLGPVAEAGENLTGAINELIRFNAAYSSDPEGENLNYFWDFGDGETAEGVSVEHRYTNPGLYRATLTVRDSQFAATDFLLVHIARPVLTVNLHPIAEAGENLAGLINEPVRFSGTASSDPEGEDLTYLWDFGDRETTEGVNVEHHYTNPGLYRVTLTVSDGKLAAIDTVMVRIDKPITTETVVIAPSFDTGVWEKFPDYNYAAVDEVPVYIKNPVDSERAANFLLHFNLDDLPEGVEIEQATLKLVASRDFFSEESDSMWLRAAPLLTNWGAATATWVDATRRQPWDRLGGDYVPVLGTCADLVKPADCTELQPKGDITALDVTPMVRGWNTKHTANLGMAVVADTSVRWIYTYFYTKEAAAPENRPVLVITYKK